LTKVVYPAINAKATSVTDARAVKRAADAGVKPGTQIADKFPPGAFVMVFNELKTSKSEPTYLGPYKVVRRNQGGAYVLSDPRGKLFKRAPDHLKLVLRTQDANEANAFNAVKIIDHRGTIDNREYLVEWFGSDTNTPLPATWLKPSQIDNVTFITDYWEAERIQREISNPVIVTLPAPAVNAPTNPKSASKRPNLQHPIESANQQHPKLPKLRVKFRN
jgi:hypothetical protein